MKQRIRLTEGDLHRIIRKCVNEALNEGKIVQNRQVIYPNAHDEVGDDGYVYTVLKDKFADEAFSDEAVRKRLERAKRNAYVPNEEARIVVCRLYGIDKAKEMVRNYSIQDWAQVYGTEYRYKLYVTYEELDKNKYKRLAANKYVELWQEIDTDQEPELVIVLRKGLEQLFSHEYYLFLN